MFHMLGRQLNLMEAPLLIWTAARTGRFPTRTLRGEDQSHTRPAPALIANLAAQLPGETV
jgi:hypothetical protein